ncbi:MAG: hypothetical protein KDD40_00175 [Bdellovibrionales bacterium]|nr:hypothetical protein [Bdellovibrionales bacterium]
MKIIILLSILFSFNLFAREPFLCQPRNKNLIPLYTQYDKSSYHVFFVRCHPYLPYVFSNQVPYKDGEQSEHMRPVMIDMRTGKQSFIPLPNEPGVYWRAEDLVPSPDGKYLYADLDSYKPEAPVFENSKNYLGIYEIKNGKISEVEKIETTISYPSPAIRNGQRYIMGREGISRGRFGPQLKVLNKNGGKHTLEDGPIICSEHEINIMSENVDMPYVSSDASYFGSNMKNQLHIFKLNWDQAKNVNGRKHIPCDIVTRLPSGSGKVSFSPDNKGLVFHTYINSGQGYDVPEDYTGADSFYMDLETQQMIQLTQSQNNIMSEFPYFCGDNGIVVREQTYDDTYKTRFQVIPMPILSTRVFKNNCELTPEENKESLTHFWKEICHRLGYATDVMDIHVTSDNCKDLIKHWERFKGSSRITRQQIKDACEP